MPSSSLSSSTMINPYTQPHRSLSMRSAEDNMKQMLRHHNRCPPSVDIVRPLLDHILFQPKSIDWTEDMIKDLVMLVLNLLHPFLSSTSPTTPHSVPDETILVLALVTAAMEEWHDDVVYMALLQELDGSQSTQSTHPSFLDVLVDLSVSRYNQQVRQIALIGLATAFRSMDRLHQYLTLDIGRPDMSWWLERLNDENLVKITFMCMNCLLDSNVSVEIHHKVYQPPEDQIQYAATSFLATILKRDHINAIEGYGEKEFVELCHHLVDKVKILINLPHSQIPSKWYLPCSLVSSTLLTLIRWRYGLDTTNFGKRNHSQEQPLVETVTGFAFPLAQENKSVYDTLGWMSREDDVERVRTHALDVIQVWALEAGQAWSVFLKNEKDWRGSIEHFWTYCLHQYQSSTHETHRISNDFRGALLVHTLSRSITKQELSAALHHSKVNSHTPEQEITTFLTSIFHFFDDPNPSIRLQAVCMVRTLLSDRSSLTHHDDISRAIWESVDTKVVERTLNFITKSRQINETTKPLLLAYLDLCDVLLQDKKTCEAAIGFINAQNLEQMISLVVPTNIKFDYKETTGWDELSLDGASDTPPANNLSRMDENSICVEQEGERILKGIDATIQLSCSTLLARLGYNRSYSSDEGVYLIKSRACKVVNHMFSTCSSTIATSFSFDCYKRFIRLQRAIAISDNEDFVASTMFAAQFASQQMCTQIKQRNERAEKELEEAKRRSQDLEDRVTQLTSQVRSKSVIFKRELSRIIGNTSQDAKQLVSYHADQRSSAEKKLTEYSRQLEETKSKLQSVLLQAQESQLLVDRTKDELKHALALVTTLENTNQNLSQQIDRENRRLKELEEESRSQLHKIDSLVRAQQALEAEVQDRHRVIDDCEAMNENLRVNLEELFGDMVSLAAIYEDKENEATKLQTTHHNELERTKSQLRREKEQNAELTGTIDQLREANDKLHRKLAKYKEFIQNERREKELDSQRRKRNGPVSYINQLHQSTSYSRSLGDDSSTITHNKSGRSQAHVEKENNYSSSEYRRKNY